jgi:hypothetical protein
MKFVPKKHGFEQKHCSTVEIGGAGKLGNGEKECAYRNFNGLTITIAVTLGRRLGTVQVPIGLGNALMRQKRVISSQY